MILTPLGDDISTSFDGTFNGGGFIIRNLTIDRDEELCSSIWL